MDTIRLYCQRCGIRCEYRYRTVELNDSGAGVTILQVCRSCWQFFQRKGMGDELG